MNRLIDSIEASGATILRDCFELSNFNGTHRGILSNCDIEKETQLCKVPFQSCFSARKSRKHPVIGEPIRNTNSLSDQDALAVLLMYSRINGASCELRYVQFLKY